MDNLLDSCPTLDYASDFQLLLNQRLTLPLDAELHWADLSLNTNPASSLPGLSYSLLTLVDNIQPLRYGLASKAQNREGLIIFDRCLLEKSAPAMVNETRWRLGIDKMPDFAHYLANAHLSMCGNLCTATVNAVLPKPTMHWQVIQPAMITMCHAIRLINDMATYPKDKAEGKPNPVHLLAYEINANEQESENEIRKKVDNYEHQLLSLISPYLASDHKGPLYILSYYIYHVLIMTRAMYSKGDFIEVGTSIYNSSWHNIGKGKENEPEG